MANQHPPFPSSLISSYLQLAPDSQDAINLTAQPILFLQKHLTLLPPHLLTHFSSITTPKQRSVIPKIRNRRLAYHDKNPFTFAAARSQFPALWTGREPRGREEGEDEKEWVESGFLEGRQKTHVGKLGKLLGEYEEEREAERVRGMRKRAADDDFIPEEDEDTDEEDEAMGGVPGADVPEESAEESQASFLRLVKERFIYGLLEGADYDVVDWDDALDAEEDEAQERWFDEESEGE